MSLENFDWDKCERGYKAKIVLEDFYKSVGADISVDLSSLYSDMDFFLNINHDNSHQYQRHGAS